MSSSSCKNGTVLQYYKQAKYASALKLGLDEHAQLEHDSDEHQMQQICRRIQLQMLQKCTTNYDHIHIVKGYANVIIQSSLQKNYSCCSEHLANKQSNDEFPSKCELRVTL